MSAPTGIPAYLPYGIVSIYGIGSLTGSTGMVIDNSLRFGTIEQVSQYQIYWAQVGDSVLFKEADVECRLAYDNSAHTIIPEVKLVLREVPLP